MTRFPGLPSLRALVAIMSCGLFLAASGQAVAQQKRGASPKVQVKVKSGDAAYNQLLRDAARRTSQGQHSQALESYRRILLAYPDDLNATRGSADALVALGRRDEAEAFLKDYLARKGYDEAIWRSLAEIHRAREQYDVFLSDLIEILKGVPAGSPLPMSWALRSFEDLASEPATADRVEPAIRKLIAEKGKDNPEIRILMADVLLRRNDSAGALSEVVEADRSSRAGGTILFQYGEELYGSGRTPLAEAAYVKAAEAATETQFRTQAWSRVADVAMEQKRYTTAAAAYEAIAGASPGTAAGVEALLNLAEIQQTHLRDYAAALAAYKALEGNPGLGARQATLYLQTADCHLRMDQPDEAIAVLNKLKAGPAEPEVQAEGEFLAAEIKFFKGDFPGAQAAYQSLAENFTRTRKTNDAVGRYLQIARAMDRKEMDALKMYAAMEKYTRMSDTTNVLDTSRKLQADFAATDLAADALVREAEMIRNRGKAEAAVLLCQRAVAEHPGARIAAYALAVMGDIFLSDLSDKKRALAAFERLLDEYPENLLAAEVRRTVEKLRRNSES